MPVRSATVSGYESEAVAAEMAEVEKVLERMTLAQYQGGAGKVQLLIGKLGAKGAAWLGQKLE